MATVLYPVLAEQAAVQRMDKLRSTVSYGLRTMAFVLLPMSLGLMLFREPIVALFFERGAFNPRATVATAAALQYLAPGILFFGWLDYLNRTLLALRDPWTPMWTAVWPWRPQPSG